MQKIVCILIAVASFSLFATGNEIEMLQIKPKAHAENFAPYELVPAAQPRSSRDRQAEWCLDIRQVRSVIYNYVWYFLGY